MTASLQSAPPIVQAWIVQLLEPGLVETIRKATEAGHQVDVRLTSSADGKVRARPAVVLNGGPQQMVDPAAMLTPLRSVPAR